MMKNETFLCAAASLLLFAACQAVLPPAEQAEGGRAAVTIALTTGGERTVLPQVSLADVSRFSLSGAVSGGAAAELASFTSASGAQVFLEPGTWDFILNAYNGADALILQGSAQNQTISLSGGNTISFTLFPLETGQGSISIRVDCPAVITRVSAAVDGGAESGANLTLNDTASGKRAVYAETRSAGSYFIVLRFYDGDNTLRGVVSELAVVAGNLSSAKTLALAEGDLKAAAPPVVPPGIVVPEGGEIIHIGTQAELAAINDHIVDPAKNYGKNAYVLDNDITLSGTWTPIGKAETVDNNNNPTGGVHAFSGNFYGNGHTIHNLVLPGGDVYHIGLFGWVDSAEIRGLLVELADVTISVTANSRFKDIAGITGKMKDTSIVNCAVYSSNGITVNGSSFYCINVGGISGENTGTNNIIENCYVAINITVTHGGTHIQAGGISPNVSGVIRNCYYAGTITGTGTYANLHGITVSSHQTQNSYSAGSIVNNNSGASYSSSSGVIRNGYSSNSAAIMASIIHTNNANHARIQKHPDTSVQIILTNNYAWSGMTLNGSAVTSGDANGVQGLDKSAAQLKQRSTYETGLGWDFDTVWEMGPPSYPFPILQWQNGVHIPQGFTVIED